MKKTFNIYCDESTHLQNDGMPYMLISYVSCAYPQLKIHKAYVQQLRDSGLDYYLLSAYYLNKSWATKNMLKKMKNKLPTVL